MGSYAIPYRCDQPVSPQRKELPETMTKITLTIKGNAATAQHETAKRNLDFTLENQDERWNTVVGTIPYTEANWWTVAKWFNSEDDFKAPFPDGSLLYYATRHEAIEVVAQARHLGS